jgi:hypothetical protein
MARLLMGVIVEAPEVKVSLDKMPQFLIDQTMKQNIFDDGDEPQFRSNERDEGVFAPLPRDPPPPEEERDPEKRVKPWRDLKAAWEQTLTPQEGRGHVGGGFWMGSGLLVGR